MLKSVLLATLLLIPHSMCRCPLSRRLTGYHNPNEDSEESGGHYKRKKKQHDHWSNGDYISNNKKNTERCPGLYQGTPPLNQDAIPDFKDYEKALKDLDISAVITDINALLTESQDCWPSDTFHDQSSYGPLFIRLAWHCSGSFRESDGTGGCAGGRIRFDPETSWGDNTNLDKARALLAPIKNKYGIALSWGDLMVFAGATSIWNMGGPVNQICAGRVDSKNGEESLALGPGPEAPPCPTPGDCPPPLGSEEIGLIYVNPEGFMGEPVPKKSAPQIREVFGRMGMNDRETVALIGGGHAFGKSHGACSDGPGLSPNEDRYNPWSGRCGTGKGADTFTSGIEGYWTSNPFKWDNEYFELLNDEGFDYKLITGPGGKYQWKNKNDGKLMMQTSDLALIYDVKYREIVREFADDLDALNVAFSGAWSKLTSRGGKWAKKKCFDMDDLKNDSNGKEKYYEH